MNPNLRFKPDRADPLAGYLASIRSQLPAVDALITRHQGTRLSHYVGGLGKRRPPALQCKRDFIAEVARQTAAALGPSIGAAIEQDLLDTPQVLTANHHGIDTFAQSTQSNLLFSLRRRSDGTPMKTVPVLACGSVPLNNLTYPRGLLVYAGADEAGMLRLPIFPDSAKRKLVSVASAFNDDMLDRTGARAAGLSRQRQLSTPMAGAVDVLLDDFRSLTRDFEQYGRQATVANNLIWRRLFSGRFQQSELVYIELERVASRLLEFDLFDPGSICHQLMFDPQLRRKLIEKLDGQRGCWQQEGLARRNSEAGEARGNGVAMGTMFFWAVDAKSRQVPLRVVECAAGGAELRGVDDAGNEWCIALTPQSILRELQQGRLLPSIFTSYLVIAIARGVSCIGGYYQADYLPNMQDAVLSVLGNLTSTAHRIRGNAEPGPDLYLSGMQTIGIRDGERMLPAGPLEMIACGGLDEDQYARIGEVTVFQSHIASLFDMVMDAAPGGHDARGVQDEIAKLVCASVGEKIVTISMEWKPVSC
ncbi:MAG: hypothetical protein QNJ85_06000 [Gammaproteobacteria bacterium]|nr:hypothetical protein [Gammaproteobacteria bacterium]